MGVAILLSALRLSISFAPLREMFQARLWIHAKAQSDTKGAKGLQPEMKSSRIPSTA
jgi:hypothetical protein